MKSLWFYFILVITISLSSCSENDAPLFLMQTEADFVIPAGLNTIETHFFILQDVPTFFNAVNTTNDTSEISQIVARRATLSPVFDVLNLDYINSVNIYILNPNNLNERKEIFFMDFIALGNKQEINLFSSIVNVKEFLVSDRMLLEVGINFRQIPLQTSDYRLEMSFNAFGLE